MRSRPGVRGTNALRQVRKGAGWLGLLLGSLVGAAGLAQARQAAADTQPHPSGKPAHAAPVLPLDELPAAYQERVRSMVEKPTLRTLGPVETFNCQPVQYFWLLDHPEITVRLWQCLGAKVSGITSQGGGRFTWEDGQGSRVEWDTILHTVRHRVWYAEGQIKPGLLLPTVSLRALVVDYHAEGHDGDGRPAMRHQFELILQTDNAAVALAARLLGASAPHLAEQYVGQIEMFYGAMAWYLDENPREAAAMFAKVLRPGSADKHGTRGSKAGGTGDARGVLTGGKS
jgi:hypothetical protein